MGIFQAENMLPELRGQLEAGKVASDISLHYSQSVEERRWVEQLENLFLRQVLGAANEQRLKEIVQSLSEQGVLQESDQVDAGVLREQAASIVKQNADLRLKASLLQKHGFDSDEGNHAITVLCAMRYMITLQRIS